MSFPRTLPASRVPPAMEAPALRWGILGTGWIASSFTRSVTAHTTQIIAAAGSRRPETAKAFAEAHGIPRAHGSYDDLVADPEIDVVYVATPHNWHHAHALMALKAGKHVLVEKPLALDLAQATEMVALARSKERFLAEALWTYFLPKFDVLEQIIESGALGEVRSIYTEYGEYLPRSHRLFDPKLAGGPLLDLGTYPISFITKLMGVPARMVGLGQSDPSGVNGQLAVVMADAAGNIATMATSAYGFSPTDAAIIGSNATLRFCSQFHLPGSFELRDLDDEVVLRHQEPIGAHLEGLYFEAAEVARCVAAGSTEAPQRTLDDTLAAMATLDMVRVAVGIDFADARLSDER